MKRISILLLAALTAEGRPLLNPAPSMMEVYCHETCGECKYSKSECGKVAEANLAVVSRGGNALEEWCRAIETCVRICPLA